MGLENRDYYRDSYENSDGGGGEGGWGAPRVTSVCKYLLIANIAVFIVQIFWTRPYSLTDIRHLAERKNVQPSEGDEQQISVVQNWLELDTYKVIHRWQVWRIITCEFCHDRKSPWHIVINMLLLFWFGKTLEMMYGGREFLYFYLTAAVLASLAFIGLDLFTGDVGTMIGASGAVMAVMMLYAIHYPRQTILLFFVIPVEIRWLVLFYVIFDLYPVLLALKGKESYDGIAHAAHLGGLAFGFLYWRWKLRLEKIFGWLRLPRLDRLFGSRRRIRVYRPSHEKHEKMDNEVDRILRKIHAEGEASLTERERKTLRKASEQYKHRQSDPADEEL